MKWRFSGLVLTVAILAAGCGGGDKTPDNGEGTKATPPGNGPETAPSDGEKSPAANAFPADKATATLSGRVFYEGDPPPQDRTVSEEVIAAANDAYCKKHHLDNPVLIEDLIVSPEGALRNVLVYVKKFPEDWTHTPSADPVVLDQVNCTYVPHVFGVMVGQPIEVTSNDDTPHNVHLFARRKAGENFAIAKGKKKNVEFKFPEPLGSSYFMCDYHGWMKAWVGVFKHPFFAVTGEDGSFTLPKLPPGTYTIAAWHEQPDLLKPQEREVTVKAGETQTVDFTFKPEE